MDHPETAPPRSPSHNQPPNTDTIAYASKFLLNGSWYRCLLWGYAITWQIQEWMLTVIYRMEHRVLDGGSRESTQGAKGNCNPIGGTTIWTNQDPWALVSSCICIKNGLVSHHWKERPIGHTNFICPSTGERQGQKFGNGWVGKWGGRVWGTFGIALEM